VNTTDQKRRERARNGSRRQRDLEAAAPVIDWTAYIAEHFPGEHYGYALVHAQMLYLRMPNREKQAPDPAEVRTRMESFGHTREQLAAAA
jgi:hypothetical protein